MELFENALAKNTKLIWTELSNHKNLNKPVTLKYFKTLRNCVLIILNLTVPKKNKMGPLGLKGIFQTRNNLFN